MRKLKNWLDAWLEHAEPLPSPAIWRKWAGIFVLGAALERRVWVRTAIGNLYPNLYVVFVGPPGTGKTVMTSAVRTTLNSLVIDGNTNSFHLASSSETYASLIDSLRDAERKFIDNNSMEAVSYNSLTVVSNELGVLLPEYDPTMMNKLTDLYDAHPYSERRRTKELFFTIPQPQINLIAATTPSFLMETLHEGAWDQGFLSRTMLAFSAESMTRDIFTEVISTDSIFKDLTADLKDLFTVYGKMTFSREAVEAIENWNKKGRPPLPDHPKLLHYNTRRAAHLIKLCMIASIAESNALEITVEHYRQALDWLIELECYMPDIFKAMSMGGDNRAMEEVWYQCAALWAKDQKPIPEARIISFIAARAPATSVGRVFEVMVKTGLFIEVPFAAAGKWYEPAQRKR